MTESRLLRIQEWVRNNGLELAVHGTSFRRAAKQASAELKLRVSRQYLSTKAKELRSPWRGVEPPISFFATPLSSAEWDRAIIAVWEFRTSYTNRWMRVTFLQRIMRREGYVVDFNAAMESARHLRLRGVRTKGTEPGDAEITWEPRDE